MGTTVLTSVPLLGFEFETGSFLLNLLSPSISHSPPPACVLFDYLVCIPGCFSTPRLGFPPRLLSSPSVDPTLVLHCLSSSFHGSYSPSSYRPKHSCHDLPTTGPPHLLSAQGFQARVRLQVGKRVFSRIPISLHSQMFQGRCNLRSGYLVLLSKSHLV